MMTVGRIAEGKWQIWRLRERAESFSVVVNQLADLPGGKLDCQQGQGDVKPGLGLDEAIKSG